MATRPRLGVMFGGSDKRSSVLNTQHSVWPQMLSTSLLGAARPQAKAEGSGRGSPEKMEYRSEGNAPGCSIFNCSRKTAVDGTEAQTICCYCWIRLKGSI